MQTERNFLVAQLDNYALERKLEPEAQDAKAQETMDLMRSEMDEMKSQLQSALSSLQTKGEDSIPANEQREDTEMAREQKKRFAELYEQNSALEAELSTLHTTLTVQSKEILSLENQVDKASNLLGSGLFDSSSTRVLSLVNNPASQDLAIRKSELDLLAKENKALLARLDAMNSKHNPTDSGGVPSESLEVLKSEVEKLKQTLVQKDKAAQRIKEVRCAMVSLFVM